MNSAQLGQLLNEQRAADLAAVVLENAEMSGRGWRSCYCAVVICGDVLQAGSGDSTWEALRDATELEHASELAESRIEENWRAEDGDGAGHFRLQVRAIYDVESAAVAWLFK